MFVYIYVHVYEIFTMFFRVLPPLITLMSGHGSLQCFYVTRRSKNLSQGRKRIDVILSKYQIWQAEWGCTGIFCFIKVDALISKHTVSHHKVTFMNQNYIWQPSVCKSCCL